MNTSIQVWHCINKSDWTNKNGLWMTEPDKAQWIYKNLDCLMVRGPHGAWCGYVGIPDQHPLYGIDYSQCHTDIDVHYGLTFSNKCSEEPHDLSICHTGDTIANKSVWWLGFDCAHLTDVVPNDWIFNADYHWQASYKDFAFVKKEVESLADQLKDYPTGAK